MSAHNLPVGSSPCADAKGICGHLRRAHANAKGDRQWGGEGSAVRQRRRCCFNVNSRSGTCTLANVNEQTTQPPHTPPPCSLSLKHTPTHSGAGSSPGVGCCLWACALWTASQTPVCPNSLREIQRSACLNHLRLKEHRGKNLCERTNATRMRTDLPAGRNCKQWSVHPTANQRSSDLLQKFSASGFSLNPAEVSGWTLKDHLKDQRWSTF